MSLYSLLDLLAERRVLPRRKKRRAPVRFLVERLENRALLATLTVNSPADTNARDGSLTLREALLLANGDMAYSSLTQQEQNQVTNGTPAASQLDTIDFAIGSGLQKISLLSALPVITDSIVIDGTSQPGYAPQNPVIVIDGTQVGNSVGLLFVDGGNTVKGLVVDNFGGFGLVLDGSDDFVHGNGPGLNNIIQADFIGTDASGRVAAPNAAGGIDVFQSSYNLIGGVNDAGPLSEGNLISGNGLTGIFLEDQSDTNNYIEGNYIGTDVDGLNALPAPGATGTDGIFLGPPRGSSQLGFASNNFIGNFDPISKQFEPDGGNVIAGNTKNGVYVLGGSGNLIAGNYIGVGSDGSTPVGNGEDGVRLDDASANIIGGTQANSRNVISANYNGVEIETIGTSENLISMPVAQQRALSNVVQGNYIGTDSGGLAIKQGEIPLGNSQNGVVLANFASDPSATVAFNLIGGDDASDGTSDSIVMARNIISGNFNDGILMQSPGVISNTVQGNYIGTNKNGDTKLPNAHSGVALDGFALMGQMVGPTANTIGGGTPGAGNVISGNGTPASGTVPGQGQGVLITDFSDDNVLEGNKIGTTADGRGPLPNVNGIVIDSSSGNVIGDLNAGNVISANTLEGVVITGASASGNKLQKNLIGVAADLSVSLPNFDGVVIKDHASGNFVGGTQVVGGVESSLGNTIAANFLVGVTIADGATTNQVIGNGIGMSITSPGIALKGNYESVDISDAANNTIGGTTPAARNFIVNSLEDGVYLFDSSVTGTLTVGNVVEGNYIGTGTDGTSKGLGNNIGVEINGAAANTIGGAVAGARNVISGNSESGVSIHGSTATANIVAGNFIGTTADGMQPLPNLLAGLTIADGAAFNVIGVAGDLGRNVISGNSSNGLAITQAGISNSVRNNYIGLTMQGTSALPNTGGSGIFVADTLLTQIGGDDPSLRNVISGNGGEGIELESGANSTLILGNYIGTDKDATPIIVDQTADLPLANSLGGIIVANDEATVAAAQVTIRANVIGGNKMFGIELKDGTTGDHVEANYIGTTVNGDQIPNVNAGIKIDDSPGNWIGGAATGTGNFIYYTAKDPANPGSGDGIVIEGAKSRINEILNNVIAANASSGITLQKGAANNLIGASTADFNTVILNGASGIIISGAGTNENVVRGNYIGINASGAAQGNTGAGILLSNAAANNIIGGYFKQTGNVISANAVGIQLQAGAAGNYLVGNFIGTALDGTAAAGLGNGTGIVSAIAGPNTIGEPTSAPGVTPGNEILGNTLGIKIVGGTSVDTDTHVQYFDVGNTIQGNEIAKSTQDGIEITNSAFNNQVGGPDSADANSIHDNTGDGLDVASGSANSILHNQIFANGGLGILLDPSGGGNDLQAAPTLSLATTGESHRVAGWIQAAAGTTYTIEFFSGQVQQGLNGAEKDDARTFVKVILVTTNSSGFRKFDVALPDGMADETNLRATATDPIGNTSQFSNAVIVQTDSDGDGIADAVENNAPGGDSQNASVVSFPDALNPNSFVTLQAPSGVNVENAWSIPNPSPSDAPAHTVFGLGFVDFTLTGVSPGQHVTVTMTLPVPMPDGSIYWRYGPTPKNSSPHWYYWNYSAKTDTGAVINGNTVTLHFVNGARGDDDLDADNNTIVDAGSPGLPDPFTVTTTADGGPGSLRQAILNANANPGADEITFQIPGTAPHTIQPLSPLPAITDSVTIDGFRLPPSEDGDDLEGTTPLVELDGRLTGPGADGLTVASGFATIQGLMIDRFSGDGIHMLTAGSADIVGNDLGTNASGASGRGNGLFGVEIENNSPPSNDEEEEPGDSGGPSTVGMGNVISGNLKGGVYLHGVGADVNSIVGNFIGTAADGISPLGNGGPGVLIDGDASGNEIGFSSADEGNTIAFNAGPGVDILQGTGNLIEANSIFANTGLGIDLGSDGVTPNDPGDTDDGPNELQNFPVLASAASYGGKTYITGTLNSSLDSFFTLDFYSSSAAGPSGYGPGETFLGSTFVGTDDGGQVLFNVNLPVGAAPGSYITATASLGDFETSEFSAALKLSPDSPLVFIVNTGDDANDPVPDPTHFSLREAILAANSHPGQDIIDFDLPNLNRVILPQSPLPDITDPVFVDGTSQPGYQGLPLVELDGSQAGSGADGLRITGGGSIVRGLVVHSFQYGIELTGLGGNILEGNFLGTDVTGTNAVPASGADVYVNLSPNNLIGGTTAAARNLIGSVYVNGYDASTSSFDQNTGGNHIEGNFIGADVTGTVAFTTELHGGIIIASSGNTIGGTTAGAGNLIEGGVFIHDVSDNVVQGNLIGTDVTGTVLLSQRLLGEIGDVEIGGNPSDIAAGNLIGGTTAAARNIIPTGVSLQGFAIENTVQGNYIGTDISGTIALNNANDGVDIAGSFNTIGGTDPGAGNLISGNDGYGVHLIPSANGNVLMGNLIGTDVTGTKALGNGGDEGVFPGIRSDGYQNTIGGDTPGAGNVISGNVGPGVVLDGFSGDLVEGNLIGTDYTGAEALGNGKFTGEQDGVVVEENNAVIGGSQPGAGNVISGNAGSGIVVRVGGYFPNGIAILGNYIGTNVTGTMPLGNGGDGVSISSSSHDAVGGAYPGAGNVIAANGGDGIRVLDGEGSTEQDHSSTGTTIQGNKIGTDVLGMRNLGNAGEGISIITSNYLASDETIGGTATGAGNTVAFNGGPGVDVPFGMGNVVEGNDIFANGGLGIITNINAVLSTYAEQRGVDAVDTAPVLTSAIFDPQGTVVAGSLAGVPFTQYDVDFFANDAVNPSGFGDGQTYLQSISVLVDDSGTAEFQIPLDQAVPVGEWITATTTPTDQSGNTSLFSRPVPVIAADPETVQFASPAYLATETGGAAVVVLTRTGSTAGTATVDYATSDETASAGTNYSAESGTVTFDDGQATTTITIPVADDHIADGGKTFLIDLTNPTSASLGAVTHAVVTIADSDTAGEIEFANAAFNVDRALGSASLDVTRLGGSQGTVTVEYRVTGGTAVPLVTTPNGDVDYEDNFGVVTFAPGQMTAEITFNYVTDLINNNFDTPVYRGPQTIQVTLGNPTGGATLGPTTTSVLTLNDEEDQHGAFGISSFSQTSINENDGKVQIDVFRAGQLSTTESVSYATVDGTAQAGTNYVATTGVFTFQPGDTEAFFYVPIIDDHIVDDPGDFQVVLSNPTGGAFILAGLGKEDVKILDSDTPTPGHFIVDASSVGENEGSATITVSRLDGTQGMAQVDYATSDGTATAGADYKATSGTLTFNNGETSKTFAVPILPDNLVEGDETFFVTLSNPTGGATIGSLDFGSSHYDNPAVETIVETAGQIKFSASDYRVAENNAGFTVIVTFTPAPGAKLVDDPNTNHYVPVTVDYSTDDGTATAGVDYAAVSGTLTIDPFLRIQAFTIPIINDSLVENDETILLKLSNATGGPSIGPVGTAMLTILDEDSQSQPPSVVGTGDFTFSATENSTPANQTLATFTDPAGADLLNNYSANIDWGDGTSATGGEIVLDTETQIFTVSGKHVYTDEGTYAIHVTLHHGAANDVTVASTATVCDPSVIGAGGFTYTATEGGSPLSQTVATFTDPAGAESLKNYSADIDWGDGASATSGVIAVNAVTHVFTVSGLHAYTDEGTFAMHVTLHHGTANDVTVASTATVSDPSVIGVGGFTYKATEGGAPLSQTVATFTDPAGAESLKNYSADVNWGDGTSTTSGVISVNAVTHVFTVTGLHAYTDEGTFTMHVTLRHGTANDVTVASTATVSDPAVIGAGGFTYKATVGGASTSQTVATFTDPAGAESLKNYSADVNWGDGTSPTSGVIAVNSQTHVFTVTGQHAYANGGTFAIHVTLHHGTASDVTETNTANVSSASAIALSGTAVNGFEFSPLVNVVVATFTASGTPSTNTFSATIGWGDGVTSSGSISLSSGTYTVTGSHTYHDENTYSMSVTITGGGLTTAVTPKATILEELLPDGTRGTPNERFISEVYRDFLGRKVEAGGLAVWSGFLAAGNTRAELVSEVESSIEYETDTVDMLYERYLHRAADAGGQSGFTNLIAHGDTIEQIAALIAGSPEFFSTQGGGTNDGFLVALYLDALGRPIDSQDEAMWSAKLASGTSRTSVATNILSNQEYRQDVVALDYGQLLDRLAEPAGLDVWVNELAGGATDQQISAAIASSDEYFLKTAN